MPISRREFLLDSVALITTKALRINNLFPEKKELEHEIYQTELRKGAPGQIYKDPHFKSNVLMTIKPEEVLRYYYNEPVQGDWFKWTNRPLKKSQNIGITTDDWFQVPLLSGEGYIWRGFTFDIKYSKPLPDAKRFNIFDTTKEMKNAKLHRNDRDNGTPVSDTDIEGLHKLNGLDIWLGYPDDGEPPEWNVQDGFAWPPDTEREFFFEGTGQKNQDVQIWVYRSEMDPTNIFILPFSNTEKFARKDGKYFGIHPNGAFAVPASEAKSILNKFF